MYGWSKAFHVSMVAYYYFKKQPRTGDDDDGDDVDDNQDHDHDDDALFSFDIWFAICPREAKTNGGVFF